MLLRPIVTERQTFAISDRNANFGLHAMNGPQFHRLFVRMTDYLETQSGQASRYVEYVQRGRTGYELDHVSADYSERHVEEFACPSEFAVYRNHIGGLLLPANGCNTSCVDLTYTEKRGNYLSQNLLAHSLHEQASNDNPGFRRFIAECWLPFRAHEELTKVNLEVHKDLYRQLAECIWDPGWLAQKRAP